VRRRASCATDPARRCGQLAHRRRQRSKVEEGEKTKCYFFLKMLVNISKKNVAKYLMKGFRNMLNLMFSLEKC
jgi:phosphopantetheine adenylyltransferase